MTNATREGGTTGTDLHLRPSLSKAQNDLARNNAIKTLGASRSMNLLTKTRPELLDVGDVDARAASTFTNGDLVVTYVDPERRHRHRPAGRPTDHGPGDVPPGPRHPADRRSCCRATRAVGSALARRDRRWSSTDALASRRRRVRAGPAARSSSSSPCRSSCSWPARASRSTSVASTASGASSRTLPTPAALAVANALIRGESARTPRRRAATSSPATSWPSPNGVTPACRRRPRSTSPGTPATRPTSRAGSSSRAATSASRSAATSPTRSGGSSASGSNVDRRPGAGQPQRRPAADRGSALHQRARPVCGRHGPLRRQPRTSSRTSSRPPNTVVPGQRDGRFAAHPAQPRPAVQRRQPRRRSGQPRPDHRPRRPGRAAVATAPSFRGFVALDIRNFAIVVVERLLQRGDGGHEREHAQGDARPAGSPPAIRVRPSRRSRPRPTPTTRSRSSTATRPGSSSTRSTHRYAPGDEILAAVYSGTVMTIPDFTYHRRPHDVPADHTEPQQRHARCR